MTRNEDTLKQELRRIMGLKDGQKFSHPFPIKGVLLENQEKVKEFWDKYGETLTLGDIAELFKSFGLNNWNAYRYAYRFMTTVNLTHKPYLFSKDGGNQPMYKYLPPVDPSTSMPSQLLEKYEKLRKSEKRIHYESVANIIYQVLAYYKDDLKIQSKEEKEVVEFFERLFNITVDNKEQSIYYDEMKKTYPSLLALNKYSEKTIQEYRYTIRKQLIDKFRNFNGWVFTFSDLHVPYINWKNIISALKFISNGGFSGDKILVLGGDILDFEQFSVWGGKKRIYDIPYDIIAIAKFLEAIYDLFDAVIIIEGNHERRLYNYLFKQLDKNAPYLINFINVPDLIRKYLSPELQEKVIFSPDWYAIIGEMIIAHNNKASVVKGKSVIQTIDYFQDNLRTIKFKAVMQAHTHTQVKLRHQNVWGIEIGMLGKDPSYRAIKSSRIKPIYGFGYGQLINGEFVDPNKFNFVYLGEDYIDEMIYNPIASLDNSTNIEGETIDSRELWADLFNMFDQLF